MAQLTYYFNLYSQLQTNAIVFKPPLELAQTKPTLQTLLCRQEPRLCQKLTGVGIIGWHRQADGAVKCLLAGMQRSAQKAVNCDQLREMTQGPEENPALFLSRLTEAMVLHTCSDPTSSAGATVLATYFISQSAPDTRKKN